MSCNILNYHRGCGIRKTTRLKASVLLALHRRQKMHVQTTSHTHGKCQGRKCIANGHHDILSTEQLWSEWISMWFSLVALQKFTWDLHSTPETDHNQRSDTSECNTLAPQEKLTATWGQNTERCGVSAKQTIQVFHRDGGGGEMMTTESGDFF